MDGATCLPGRSTATGGMPEQGAGWVDERFREHYLPRCTRLSGLYPTVTETLRDLRREGVALGVCTNKRQAGADLVVESLGLGRHVDVVIGGDTGVMKPDPAHLAAVLAKLGCEPHDAVMVGDSDADLQAARGLAMPCVLVRYGYARVPAGELGGDAVIDRMAELREVLARL